MKKQVFVKREHFIPQFYLDGFADAAGKLYTLRREHFDTFESVIQTTVRDVCVEKDLYEVKSSSGYIERNSTEKFLSRTEDYLAPKIKALCEFDPHNDDASSQQKSELISAAIVFVSHLFARNPKIVYPERAKKDEFTSQLKHSGFFSENDIERLNELGYESDLESLVELGIQHASIGVYAEGTPTYMLINLLSKMDMTILKAPHKAYFIASSFPYAFIWESPTAEEPSKIYFPLSKNTALLFSHTHNDRTIQFSSLSVKIVIMLNQLLIMGNDLWDVLISPKQEILRALAHGCRKHDYSANTRLSS